MASLFEVSPAAGSAFVLPAFKGLAAAGSEKLMMKWGMRPSFTGSVFGLPHWAATFATTAVGANLAEMWVSYKGGYYSENPQLRMLEDQAWAALQISLVSGGFLYGYGHLLHRGVDINITSLIANNFVGNYAGELAYQTLVTETFT